VDDVTSEMKVAMKAKDSVTLGTIRLIRTAFANAAIELRTSSLTDEQVRRTFMPFWCWFWHHVDFSQTLSKTNETHVGTNSTAKVGQNEKGIDRHV
jgi:Yqey-like protein